MQFNGMEAALLRAIILLILIAIIAWPATAITACSNSNDAGSTCRLLTSVTNCSTYSLVSDQGSFQARNLSNLSSQLKYDDVALANGTYVAVLCDGQSSQINFGGGETMIASQISRFNDFFVLVLPWLAIWLWSFTYGASKALGSRKIEGVAFLAFSIAMGLYVSVYLPDPLKLIAWATAIGAAGLIMNAITAKKSM